MGEGATMSYNQLDHSDLDAWTTPYGEGMLAPEEMFYPNRPLQRNPAAKRQPSLAALALMPKSRRIHQDTTKGLFSWPRECREALYLAVIHPYCGLPRTDNAHYNSEKGGCGYRFNHKKAMKLMVLCSQVWEEAIEIVHLAENVLCVAGKECPIFRHQKDFGKPGFFHTTAQGQILRMRKVAIKIRYPDHMNWHTDVRRTKNFNVEVSGIFAALRKSPYLEQVRIILERQSDNRAWWGEYQDEYLADQHPSMRNLLRPLIDMAHERGIKIGAEHNHEHVTVPEFDGSTNGAEWTDPLVTWLNNAAILPEMKAKFAARYNQQTEVMLEKNLGRCKNSEMPYELVPECRSCLQVFGGWEELATHLNKQPKHKMRFMYKKWNELYRWADQRGERKCPTCAKSFSGVARLDDHMEEMGHRRSTIVPRYLCDNNVYEKQAQQQAKRKAEAELRSQRGGGRGGRGGRGG